MKPFDVIETNTAPKALGCYSQATMTSSFMFLSGQIGIDPLTGELALGVESQLKQAFDNLLAVLGAAQLGAENIVKVTVFLRNMEDFAVVNSTMSHYFNMPYPARSTVEVSNLPRSALVEIEAVAVR